MIDTPALAHSGRTDSNGGHKDNKNVSGIGSYHYHHGQASHLHPGGVCPLNDSSTTNKSNSSSSSNLSPPKKSVTIDTTTQAKANTKQTGYNLGYKDAFNGKKNDSSSYSGSHTAEYKTAYNLGYTNGKQKREERISTVKSEARALVEKNGYNQVDKNKHQYLGEYSSNYMKSYLKGYASGEKKLQNDILKFSKRAYLFALEGKPFDTNISKVNSIKVKCEGAYKKGEEFRNKYLNIGSLLGQPLKNIENHIKGTKNIQLSLDTQDNNSFISIDNSNTKKVRQMNIYTSKIIEGGLNKEQAETFLNNFFTPSVLKQYNHIQTLEGRDNSDLKVYKLKINKRIGESLPKNLYVSIKLDNKLISEINISYKKPNNLRIL